MIKDYFKFAVISVKHRSLRAWLTILGIIIGVAAIIALITISYGMQASIEEQFEVFGANRIMIAAQGFMSPASGAEGLTEDDVETLKSISEYEYVTPSLIKTPEVNYHGEIVFPTVVGMPAEDFADLYEDMGVYVQSGRMLRDGDRYSAVIGYRVALDMFEDELRVKNKITIGGEDFRIVGIMEEIGNPDDDNQIIIPLDTMREVFNEPDKVDWVIAQAKPGVNMDALQEKTEKKLERVRGDENFQVMTPAQLAEQISQILSIVQFVLIGIAAISLIVGAVGIMNSMYTSVLERTKEIGIMKSVGARNSNILMLFLVESGFIGFIGGIFGVILGTGMALAVGALAAQSGFSMLRITIDYKILIFGLLFAVFVGMGSGVLPAYKASQLKPVDALRYE